MRCTCVGPASWVSPVLIAFTAPDLPLGVAEGTPLVQALFVDPGTDSSTASPPRR